ncbi:hypothetical protein [Fodinibius halophilus]|uniref:HTH araC/xylS-type domain-containing protein n=1 Tax=Fodinibius halophilus TaxID=1736908 RepID=A0A6M1T5B4_9BACT|nr:hypothetical protein [Fodinibius halophilus]NGP87151.1 hypothetical protein [Fodinibius halophilus]
MSDGEAPRLIENSKISMDRALDILEDHFHEIKMVCDWSIKMGWKGKCLFSDAFRANKAVQLLWNTTQTNYAIAIKLQLKDERGFYQFLKRQTGYSPTEIKKLTEHEYNLLIERLNNVII